MVCRPACRLGLDGLNAAANAETNPAVGRTCRKLGEGAGVIATGTGGRMRHREEVLLTHVRAALIDHHDVLLERVVCKVLVTHSFLGITVRAGWQRNWRPARLSDLAALATNLAAS